MMIIFIIKSEKNDDQLSIPKFLSTNLIIYLSV